MAPQRPGPVPIESPASGPLHNLQSELLSAQSAWQQLGVRIAKGYTAAYSQHTATLAEMKREHDAAADDALSFVRLIVSVGFAGGLVGSVMGPWILGAARGAAEKSLREGVRGIFTQAAKDIAKAGAKTFDAKSEAGDDPYTTSSPKEISLDLEIRDRIDSAFGPLLEALDAMITEANKRQSPVAIGQEILNNFRLKCPLLTDKPAQADIPSERNAARAAELAMWVAWANKFNWRAGKSFAWNQLYEQLDYWRLSLAKRDEIQENARLRGQVSEAAHHANPAVLKEWVFQFNPIGKRMLALDKWGAVYDSVLLYPQSRYNPNTRTYDPQVSPITEDTSYAAYGDSYFYIDLRKLRNLRLDDPILPFRKLTGLSLQWEKTRSFQQADFLIKLLDVKPIYK